MQTIFKAIITSVLVFCSTIICAQDKSAALITEGIALQKTGKHAEAIIQFKAALETEPENVPANYQTAFSLVALKKGEEAIPYAEKVIKTKTNYTAAAYSLLGGIYDSAGLAANAITVYNEGLKTFPADQNMWFNLGLAYFRNKQYADAENAATEAIKLDVKHANSQRLYALVAFHQNKRMNALLGLCSFLLTDPSSPRAEEAYTNILSILQGGVLKGADTKELSPGEVKEATALNGGIASVIHSSTAQKLSGVALLEYELKNIFAFAGESSGKKAKKGFFDNFFVAYFYKLAKSDDILAFAELVSNSGQQGGYEKWRKASPAKAIGLDEWVKVTERKF